FFVNALKKPRTELAVNVNCRCDNPIGNFRIPQSFSCFPTFLIHQILPAAPAFSQPGSRGRDVSVIVCSVISSSGVYSGGIGGGTGFRERAVNSSRNFSTKLWVGQAQASPKAQMVRPAMLSATFF